MNPYPSGPVLVNFHIEYENIGFGDLSDLILGLDCRLTEAALFSAVEHHPFQYVLSRAVMRVGEIPPAYSSMERPEERRSFELIVDSLVAGLDGSEKDQASINLRKLLQSPAPESGVVELALKYFDRQAHEQFLLDRRKAGASVPQFKLVALSTGSIDLLVDATTVLSVYAPVLYMAMPELIRESFIRWVVQCCFDGIKAVSSIGHRQSRPSLRDVEDTFKRLARGNKYSSLSITVDGIKIEGVARPSSESGEVSATPS